MINPEIAAIAEKIVAHLDGWEMYPEDDMAWPCVMAVLGNNAISFTKMREMVRVASIFHPDYKYDRSQPFKKYSLTFFPRVSPEILARKIKDELLPKIAEQSRLLILSTP